MKNIYALSLLFSFVIISSACSKDFLKRYDKRIVGTWYISDINRLGFSGNFDRLTFRDGTLIFGEDGNFTYISSTNVTYEGSWDIQKKTIGEETVRSLHITAVDFNTQDIVSEYYDNMIFVGTDHFKAEVNYNTYSFMTHFRR